VRDSTPTMSAIAHRYFRDRFIVDVPSIYRGPAAYGQLCDLWALVQGVEAEITFSLRNCLFLSQTAVAFLGGLIRWIESSGGVAGLNWQSVSHRILTNLRQNGFAATFTNEYGPWQGNSVPYREDRVDVEANLIGYLKNSWLMEDWVHFTPDLRNEVAGKVWEIYANAFEHAGSPVGVFTCGQHFPKARKLDLSVIDFGVGIPANVREYLINDELPAEQAMEWAAQRGNTTNPRGLGRGLGLDVLRELIDINKGSLEIYSHDGFLGVGTDGTSAQSGGPYFGSIDGDPFPGTIVVLTLRCDDLMYTLASDQPEAPLF